MKSAFHSETYRKKQEAEILGDDLKELFMVMLEVHKGNLSAAARAVNISGSAVYLWRSKDPEFKALMEEIRENTAEVRLDDAESAIDDLITVRDGATARWFLDRKGRERGYGQVVKQRHGGVDGPRIQVDVEGDYPPVPQSLEEWEEQQEQARERRAAAKAGADT